MAAKLGEVEASTIFDSSAELSDDETTVHVSLKNKSGVEVTVSTSLRRRRWRR